MLFSFSALRSGINPFLAMSCARTFAFPSWTSWLLEFAVFKRRAATGEQPRHTNQYRAFDGPPSGKDASVFAELLASSRFDCPPKGAHGTADPGRQLLPRCPLISASSGFRCRNSTQFCTQLGKQDPERAHSQVLTSSSRKRLTPSVTQVVVFWGARRLSGATLVA